MSKLLLKKEYARDDHFHGIEIPGMYSVELGKDTLHLLRVNDSVLIILCLDSDGKLVLGLSVNGEMRYISFDEMNKKSLSFIEYAENKRAIRLYNEEQTTGIKHILESDNRDKKSKLVNYKVTEKDVPNLQTAIFNHPRIKELIDYIIKKLEESDPNIIEFLNKDRRFVKMLALSKKQVTIAAEAVIDYYFISSSMIETGVEIPEENVKK